MFVSSRVTYQSIGKTVSVELDLSERHHTEARYSMLLSLFIVVELVIFITALNSATSMLLVVPLTRIFNVIRTNAKNILNALEFEEVTP